MPAKTRLFDFATCRATASAASGVRAPVRRVPMSSSTKISSGLPDSPAARDSASATATLSVTTLSPVAFSFRAAGAGQHFGLAQRRRADADGARGDLELGDADRLVRLGVRAEPDAVLAAMRGHLRDVALHRVEIDHQSRRRQRIARAGLADEWGVDGVLRHAGALLRSSEYTPRRLAGKGGPSG
jgi:hypothetical protein